MSEYQVRLGEKVTDKIVNCGAGVYWYIDKLQSEIERLNNNWNELEKYTKKEIKKWKEEEKTENDYSARANILGYITGMENVQDKIQELKG